MLYKNKSWKPEKFNAASQTTLEIYSHTPDVSDGIKKSLY
ncbi:15646_t:CDS:2 [Entrophospora sp. SA101]|nr:15646_t:CDS:2 [Entrophospora sp. SA101]